MKALTKSIKYLLSNIILFNKKILTTFLMCLFSLYFMYLYISKLIRYKRLRYTGIAWQCASGVTMVSLREYRVGVRVSRVLPPWRYTANPFHTGPVLEGPVELIYRLRLQTASFISNYWALSLIARILVLIFLPVRNAVCL